MALRREGMSALLMLWKAGACYRFYRRRSKTLRNRYTRTLRVAMEVYRRGKGRGRGAGRDQLGVFNSSAQDGPVRVREDEPRPSFYVVKDDK